MAFGCSQAQEIKNCIWTEIGQMRVKTGQRPAPSARTDTEQALESPLQASKNRKWDQLPNASGDRPSELRIAMALARPFWKGYLKLSLVSCPIAMFPASSSRERVSFRQINKKTGHRLKQQLVDSVTGEVVESQDKGRGYEIGKNEYMPVEDEDWIISPWKAPTPSILRS